MFCTLTGMLFYVHTLVVYILLPVFSLITSVSILIFLLDLPYSLSDFLRIDSIVLDTVVYGMVFIIGILYIMGCIVVILQAKRLSTPLAALPLTKMSNKIQWKSSVIGVVVSLLVLLVYFIIGDIVKTYPQVPVAYFEKTLDSTLADEENGYLQLAKFVSKYKGNTIEKLSSLLEEYQGEYLIRT
ncbi:MAG: hypothetical protein LBG52_00700 [Candidatus Peribacteria bacterium]|nr:hypothetical protein [Candidatus Peribacteria bacterium]